MCRLLGMVSNRPTSLTFSLLDAKKSLRRQAEDHRDGWGIAAYSQEEWIHCRKPESALDSLGFENISRTLTGSLFISHIRLASVGSADDERNTHPFLRDGWVLAHNGTIPKDGRARAKRSIDPNIQPEGETDSEAFFCLFLTVLRQHSPSYPIASRDQVIRSLRESIDYVRDHNGLNLLISDGQTLYVYRDGRDLVWLHRSFVDREEMHSRELRLVLQDKARRNEQATLVASEPLTEEEWREVPSKAICYVDGTMNELEVVPV